MGRLRRWFLFSFDRLALFNTASVLHYYCAFFFTRDEERRRRTVTRPAQRARARANDNLSAETANSATAVVERWRWGVHGNIFLLIRWAVVAVETATIALFPKCADISKNVPVPFSGEGG